MEMMDQRQWLSWLIRVRIVIITFLLGIELTIQQMAQLQNLTVVQVPMKYFLAVLLFWCVLDLIHHILLKIKLDATQQAYIQMILDTSMVTLVVYFTGGLDSYFYFLYPLTILMGSIVLSRGGAFLIASLCFIQAGVILELPYYNIIPAYALTQPDLKSLQINIAANLVAFMAVAYLASKLAVILRKTGVELEDKKEELEDLQALNQDILESMRGGLITTDLTGQIILLNSPGADILGLPFSSLKGKTIETLFPQVMAGGQPDLSKARQEICYTGAGGNEKFLGLSVSPLSRNGETVGYVYGFQDVTPMKNLEREVQLKDRMAAIGRMAAAIAHEIRNPLASIAGSVKLFSGMADLDSDQQRLIGIVLKESERLNAILTDFLLYSREKTYQFKPVNVVEILEETLTLLENRPQFAARYRVEKKLPREPVLSPLDADRMRQVFWNIGDNAVKAMPSGGTLSVEVVAGEQHLQILFCDTGNGMSPRQVEKLFEPFQSSFEGGTGLGLAIVYQIIQAHKGTIHAESTGDGTVFRIVLPSLPHLPESEAPTAKAHGEIISGR